MRNQMAKLMFLDNKIVSCKVLIKSKVGSNHDEIHGILLAENPKNKFWIIRGIKSAAGYWRMGPYFSINKEQADILIEMYESFPELRLKGKNGN